MNDVTPARAALQRALTSICEQRDLSPKQIADWSGVSERSVLDMRNAAHDPQLGQVDKVARSIGFQAWQLLSLYDDPAVLDLIQVYNDTSERGRELIRLAVEAARATKK